MINFLAHVVCAILFAFALLVVAMILGNRFVSYRNKSTSFECGFDPKDSARLPFSLRFFLLAVLFLIFDIEVALLFPVILGLYLNLYTFSILAGFIFLLILLVGLVHEWNQGSLRWVL